MRYKMSLQVKTFFDKPTYTLTYVIYNPSTLDAVVIDPVLDFDAPSGKISTESLNILRTFLDEKKLDLKMILETHAHADHITSALELKKIYPDAKTAIANTITTVQKTFCEVFETCDDIKSDGSQFDLLLSDQVLVEAGSIQFKVLFTPGHTPACACFLFEDMLFTGDSIFMPDFGTGRCDFPKGSSEDLFDSVTGVIYALPDETKIFVGHDYQPNGRELKYETTVKEQKEQNIHLKENTSKEDFVKMRSDRDKTLSAPKLLLPSIQVNIDAGRFPKSKKSDRHFLSLPVSY
jgi:glyoxylase-like metal-dependent hydrolase (beta-lactamase superfamily II)